MIKYMSLDRLNDRRIVVERDNGCNDDGRLGNLFVERVKATLFV